MKSGWLGLVIERWGSFALALTWKQPDGTPVNLTGCTARLRIWRTAGDDASLLLDLAGTVGGTDGTIQFARTLTQIEAIDARQGVHAITVEHPNGDVTPLVDGAVDFLQPGGRPPRRPLGAYAPLGSGGGADVLVVSATEVQVVAVGMQGPAGVGGAGAYREHVQSSAAATWSILHNFGRHPAAVLVTDAAGNGMLADISLFSTNEIRISFAVATAGRAYLE